MKSFQNAITLIFISLSAISFSAESKSPEASLFKDLAWREIGPYRGGRSAAVTGVRTQPLVYYFGATGGGVWKTLDAGNTWQNVSDGFFGGSIGAIAVSDSDPNVIYVGGGEKTVRGNVSHGDGIWKSTDAGKTWKHTGLADSRHIPRIRIHPQNPDLVYVAALGHLFGPNDMRGVYRSRDGGKNWERILFANRDAGAVDLILDPSNARIVYATTWRVRRKPNALESGGEGSGLWKSTDAGETWINLSHNKGLPEGTLGIIGTTVSASNPGNIYAIIESEKGGVFRSRDGGETWEKTNEDRALRQRAWYYTRIYADPKDEDTVYVLNVQFHRSKDGGKSFVKISTPHGDNHDLWISPDDPLRMIESNDGGANVSTDGGKNWTQQNNQPTAQIYRISTDNDFPYRLLGGQQDNTALRIRHRSTFGPGIGFRDWEPTAGGESGHVVAHPENPDLVFGGSYGGYLTMVNHKTEEFRDVNAWPDNPMGHGAEDFRYRFQWNFPIFFSPHKPYALYAAANVLFRSTSLGASWEIISPDLTRNDKSKLGPSGGPITNDNTGVEYYGTIFSALESPHEPGVFWTGSDDGFIHLSRDSGKTWTNVTPKIMPQWIQINSIEAHPIEKGGLYVAATMYKSDDFQPYLYRTTDWGKTWTAITTGIPKDHFTRVVRADTVRSGLLYAGTERGIYVSFNDGASWQSLQGKLPVVPITDIAVRNEQLIVATQGRSIWILDDLNPLREMTPQTGTETFHLFSPPPTIRIPFAGSAPNLRNMGKNPPAGVTVQFLLTDAKDGTAIKLEFLAADNKVLRTFEGKVKPRVEKPEPKPEGEVKPETKSAAETAPADEEKKSKEPEEEESEEKKEEVKLEPVPGWNLFSWDLRLENAKKFDGLVLWSEDGLLGPVIVPGKYQVRLTVGENSQTKPFEILADPRSTTTQADLETQLNFLLECRDKLSRVHEEIERIRSVRNQLTGLKKRLKSEEKFKTAIEMATELDNKITVIEEALYQTKNRSNQDPLNFPIRLNDKLASVTQTAGSGDFAPNAQTIAVTTELFAAIDTEMKKLQTIWTIDLPALNTNMKELEAPAITMELTKSQVTR